MKSRAGQSSLAVVGGSNVGEGMVGLLEMWRVFIIHGTAQRDNTGECGLSGEMTIKIERENAMK